MKLLLATRNQDKVKEIKAILKDPAIEFITLAKVAPKLIIPEKDETLEANAHHKALMAMRTTGLPSLGEDTSLEVKALGGKPGVKSARYAGPGAIYENNLKKLLKEMESIPFNQRQAQFRTVFALAMPARKVYLFKGVCKGMITNESKGKSGFGYDPVFIPNGYRKTFGELSKKTKNRISHRAKALAKVKGFFKKLNQN